RRRAGARDLGGRDDDVAGYGPFDPLLRLARAVPRDQARPPFGHVLPGGSALRDSDRETPLSLRCPERSFRGARHPGAAGSEELKSNHLTGREPAGLAPAPKEP